MPYADLGEVTLYYERYGTGRPVVCLHGLEGNRTHFYWLVKHLCLKEFSLLLFDQRGAGLSDKPGRACSMETLADDTAMLMATLDIASASIIGFSMGGMVAQHLALRHPTRIRRLVIGCSSPGGALAYAANLPPVEKLRSLFDLPLEKRIQGSLQAEFSAGYRARHPELAGLLHKEHLDHSPDPQSIAWRLAALHAHNVSEQLTSIRCETLIITGRPDAVIPWQNSSLMANRIPNARLHIFEPAGHRFWAEKAQEVIALLKDFLM